MEGFQKGFGELLQVFRIDSESSGGFGVVKGF